MRRREFIAAFGGAAIAWPLGAKAQQATMPLIGFLGSASAEPYAARLRAFRQGLEETGIVEGRDVAIDFRFPGEELDQLPALAAELIRRQVKVLVTGGIPASLAAKAATAAIDPNGLLRRRRPCQARTSRQPEPAGRQPHGGDYAGCRAFAKTAGAGA